MVDDQEQVAWRVGELRVVVVEILVQCTGVVFDQEVPGLLGCYDSP